jgi:predicted RNA-binding protein Jag
VLHLALKEAPGVRTASEGEGDHRAVVIHPA